MRTKSYRFFIKYLSSYIIILLIPITVLTFVVNGLFVNKLQEEVISGNLNNLDKVRYVMDDQLKWIEDMTHQLLMDDNSLYQYRISDQWGYKTWGITRELKRFQRLSPFIHEIWLYYKNENSVFTSNGVYTLPVLARQIYNFEDLSEQQLGSDLNDLDKPAVLTPKKDAVSGESFLRMFVPLFPNQKSSYGTLVYLIKESDIHRLMSTYDAIEGSTWVFEQNNRLVTGIDIQDGPSKEAMMELIRKQSLPDYQQLDIEGKQYYMFFVESKQTGWKYATLLPVSHVLHKVNQAQKWFTYGVAALLLLGGAIIYVSMIMNYKPIHQLRKESIKVLTQRGSGLNELDTVRDVLNQLALKNMELDQRVKNQAVAAKNQLLLSMLKGDFENVEELLEYGEAIGFSIACSHIRVAIVEFPTGLDIKKHPSIAEMEALLPEQYCAYGMNHLETNRYLIMISGNEMELEKLEEHMLSFRESLSQQIQAPVTVGVGSQSGISDALQSYLEAQTAIGYRFIQGVNRVIFFERIPLRPNGGDEYPQADIDSLKKAVRMGNTRQIQTSLSALMSFIKEKQPPLIVARGLCFDIIRLINEVWREMGLYDPTSDRYPDIFSIDRLETIDEFEDLIKALSLDLNHAFGDQQTTAEKPADALHLRSIDLVMAYIQTRYDNCDFSLQNMADEFGMALPNLGHFFKERTGQTLLEYTTALRMEKAKSLLTTTQMPLKNVAEDVGYYNVSSFIRRFKQLTGVTPGEYRSNGIGNDGSAFSCV